MHYDPLPCEFQAADQPVRMSFGQHAQQPWQVGDGRAWCVLRAHPAKGGANANSKVFLTVPVSVPDQAQIPAGWALYKDVATYPNFEGKVVLLGEGIDTWLGSPAGWAEFNMATVTKDGDGSYTVSNMTLGESVTINHPIPLASAAVW